ncbi:hypothetical protein Cgig2_022087 [Carnegiea gigantea]|uniref:Uncharacterized protein n=1 Tax=Carnegiea gigantea TaxID=171969 RepID=A0A9Q1KRP0_9CARY|nr:hypothetical protein Cgig2_022087 [Carnegiea gigantea]
MATFRQKPQGTRKDADDGNHNGGEVPARLRLIMIVKDSKGRWWWKDEIVDEMNKVAAFCMLFSFVGLAFILLNGFSNGVHESTLVSGNFFSSDSLQILKFLVSTVGITRNFMINLQSILTRMITDEVHATMTSERSSRILKEKVPHSIFGGELHGGDVSLEDYRPFDPSPSSKASIRPGPIQHGTPLNPYIPTPKPSPPMPSDDDQSP